jgi:murein DD-endopeptidase MepM/ murein hydrolase activator NlpD
LFLFAHAHRWSSPWGPRRGGRFARRVFGLPPAVLIGVFVWAAPCLVAPAASASATLAPAALLGASVPPPSALAARSVAGQSTTGPGARPSPPYVAPVGGPIVDHFRAPACRWCPGNRGIDDATKPGDPVRASGAGVVSFAGRIGADLYVTVQHADGLRTSYAYLATVVVTVGEVMSQGAELGTAALSVHFGVRRGDVYLDPELLLAGWRPVARLVPTDGALPRPRPAGAPGRRLPWQAGPRLMDRTIHERPPPAVVLRDVGGLPTEPQEGA